MDVISYWLHCIDIIQQNQEGVCIMEFMTIDQLAKSMGISRTKAYELAHQENFPAIKVTERRIIIPKDHLEEWLQKKMSLKTEKGEL